MTTIDVLPDDVLLAIFDFYVVRTSGEKCNIEAWQTLVHVCRRWRCVAFESPRRLDLRLVCTSGTPVGESLDIWPALPPDISGTIASASVDDIVAALGHNDRVIGIDLRLGKTGSLQWDKVLAAMQVPFPALTRLLLLCQDGLAPNLPDTFLGGSAPHLQYLVMKHVPFPGIPNLLRSATHLTRLVLQCIPLSGYISPEAMATCLSALTNLITLTLFLDYEFLDSISLRRPPPITRFILPNLTMFWFKGASEYLDDLLARIDTPRLHCVFMSFFLQTNLDTPHLVQFTSRTPMFQEPNEAHVILDLDAEVRLLWSSDNFRRISVEISYEDEESYLQVSSIAQVCAMCLLPFPTVENLRLGVFSVKTLPSELEWKDYVEDDQWLELLRPFTAVKNLYLSEEFQPDIATALEELIRGGTTEVLPSLQNIFLANFEPSGPFQEAIGQFLAARQLSGYHIAVLPM